MYTLPKSIQQISLFLERLPGIGEKSANRLAFYFFQMPEQDLIEFSKQMAQLKSKTKRCAICMNLTEEDTCSICNDAARDKRKITVVESVLDLLSMEKGNIYDGLYHVLHGRIDPLNHIGPEDIFVEELFNRVKKFTIKGSGLEVNEIILATNPDMEGEATAMYLRNKLSEIQTENNLNLSVTRLGYGMPMGGNLEYADYMTLGKAMENRKGF